MADKAHYLSHPRTTKSLGQVSVAWAADKSILSVRYIAMMGRPFLSAFSLQMLHMYICTPECLICHLVDMSQVRKVHVSLINSCMNDIEEKCVSAQTKWLEKITSFGSAIILSVLVVHCWHWSLWEHRCPTTCKLISCNRVAQSIPKSTPHSILLNLPMHSNQFGLKQFWHESRNFLLYSLWWVMGSKSKIVRLTN